MIDYLIQYWKLIVLVILLVANLLVAIFKRPKVLNTVFEVINSVVPNAIIEAEKLYGCGNGSNKLNYAVKFVVDYLSYRFNLSQKDAEKYAVIIQAEIEKVLATPQKKGD